jgi:hypothetical protein
MSEESQALPEKRVNWREQLDTEVRLYQQKRWDAETAKIARLKSLRLAKEAEDQSARQAAQPKRISKKSGGDRATAG